MNAPLVSVTVISYNQRDYLAASLQSLLNQTYANIEIVVADDASTDGSQALISDFAERNPRKIKPVFGSRNGGLGANRDRAMQACSGTYVAWLDADDLSDPFRIENQLRFMLERPQLSLSYHNMRLIRGTEFTEELVYGHHRKPREGDFRTLLLHENFITSSSVMIDMTKVPVRGYHFAEGPTFSDWHYLIRAASCGSIGFLDQVLGSYRRHDQAATHNARNMYSGVRMRREQALNAMRQEYTADRELILYCQARFHLSQLAAAYREQNMGAFLRYLVRLGGSPKISLRALADRRAQRYLLASHD